MSIHPDVKLTDWNAQTRAVILEVDQLFPGLTWGTYNGHDPHKTRAGDGMVPGYKTATGIAKGTAVADWLWDNRKRYGIWYVIWRGRIISMTYESAGWRRYFAADDPSDSKSHRNHPHFSTYTNTEPYGTVWLDRLQPGVTDSESVRIVQRALGCPVTGNYDADTISAARVFQRITLGDPPEYAEGVLGKWQTAELLKRTNTWATLRLDPSGDPTPPTVPDAPAIPEVEPAPPVIPEVDPEAPTVEYAVKAGDTLSGIAVRLGLPDWRVFLALNEGLDANRIRVGQVLRVPAPATVVDPEPEPEPAPLYPEPTSGEVYLDRLQPGVEGSDSVAYVQLWLAKVLGQEVTRSGAYDDATQGAVKAYQRDVLGDASEYADGVLGKLQTIALAQAAEAQVTIYADAKEGGQVWPEPPPPPDPVGGGPVIVRVVSVNVQDRNLASSQDDPWAPRRAALFAAVKSTRPDVALIQEATESQVQELCAALGSTWRHVDYGPDGRYGPMAIAYNAAKVTAGKLRGKALPSNRYAMALELTIGGKAFTAVCGHLDNNGGQDRGALRIEQAEVLTEWLPGEVTKDEDSPVIFAADLNDSRTGSTGPRAVMRRAGVVFVRDISGLDVQGRQWESHHGYGTLTQSGKWIDDIAVRGVKRVRSAGLVRTDKAAPVKAHRNGTDHCLVYAEVEL